MNFEQHMAALVAFLQEHREFLIPVAFLMAFGESFALISLLVPAVVFFTLLGAAAGAAGIDLLPAAIAGALGAGLGFWLSYLLGEKLGPSAAHHWPFAQHPELLPRGHAFFERWGAAGIFLGHFFGPVRAVIALVAGICAMPSLRFHLANWPASVLWSFSILYASGTAAGWLKAMLGRLAG